jgi:catechol-2,3-dioxygenase
VTTISSRTQVSGFAEVTLRARDLAVMEAFYTQVFGLGVLSREPERVWLEVGREARLGLWTPGPKEFGDEGGSHVHFAFKAPAGTLDTIAAGLGKSGHDVTGPTAHEGGDRSLYVSDPEGNVVEVWDFFHDGDGAQEGTTALADE